MFRNPCVDGNFTFDGSNAEEGIFALFDLIKDLSKWEYFKNNFDTLGPMKLFGIKVPNKITIEDIQNAHQVVEFYIGSVENLNQEHID